MGANHNHVMSPINFISGLPRYRKILNEVINSENIDDELTMALSVNYLGAKINNFDFNPADMVGDLYSIGRTIVGPMLLAFSNWLKEEANKDGIDKLFFLSREGKIMKDVYDLWCFGTPDYIGSEYLSVSRRSLSVPYLESLDDMVVIIDNIEFTGKLGVLLYERFGINRDEFKKNKIFDKYDLTVNLPNDRQLVIEYLNYFIPDILDKANNEKNGMIQYFHKIGILEIPKPAVVDVGYGGTAQKYLQRSISKSLYGYYMMTDERIRVTQDNGIRLAAKGFLLDGVPRNENAPNIFLKSFQIERFLSSDDTQLCFYNDDGSLSYREISRTEIEVIEKRKLLRKGIFDYVNEAIKSRKSYPQFKPSLHVAILLMQEFFDNQTENELAIVGELKLDDFYCGRGLV